MSISDNDRITYLSGEAVDSLTPQERAELDELRTLLETPATWEEPDRRSRIASSARSPTRRGGSGRRPDDGTPAAGRRPSRSTRRVLGISWPLRRPALAFGGLATAAAAIAVAIVLAVSGGGSAGAAAVRDGRVGDVAGSRRPRLGDADQDRHRAGEIKLSATGLPHLANGRYYQAWLKNAAGILVPVGTFNDAGKVTLWSGVPVTQFRSFSVTEQLANGNPASSGRRVLVGAAHPVH